MKNILLKGYLSVTTIACVLLSWEEVAVTRSYLFENYESRIVILASIVILLNSIFVFRYFIKNKVNFKVPAQASLIFTLIVYVGCWYQLIHIGHYFKNSFVIILLFFVSIYTIYLVASLLKIKK